MIVCRARKLRRTSVYSRPTYQSTSQQLHDNKFIQTNTNDMSITPAKSHKLHHQKNIKSVKIDSVKSQQIGNQRNSGTNNTRKIVISNTNCNQKLDHLLTPTVIKRRPVLSVISQRVESFENMKKVAPCTPQPPSDPTIVLKKKMKLKMEAEIKDKVSLMPPSSPYALICDSDDVSEL